MTDAEHDEDQGHDNSFRARAGVDQPSSGERVASMRGGTAVGVGRTLWLYLGALALVVFAVALVVSFISATNDNARIDRLKNHGIPVTVRVGDCIGNLGGSGSSGAGYTCRGSYTIEGKVYQSDGSYSASGFIYREVIGSMTTFSAPGTRVIAVADPSRPSTVVLKSAVIASVASATAYVAPGLLALLLFVLTFAFFRVSRRSVARRRDAATFPS